MKANKEYYEIGKCLSPYLSEMRFSLMTETAKLNVSDEVTTSLLKFISTKYNEMDFSEIEKSFGDIRKFKYIDVIKENMGLLEEIYKHHDSTIYNDYIKSCKIIMVHLEEERETYSKAFLKEIGLLQINYTTMVTTVIYTISLLITATVRFISIDNSSEITVIVEEISKHANYVFLKNSRAYAALITSGDINTVNRAFIKQESLNESMMLSTAGITVLAVPIILLVIFRIIPIIREVIYAVYFMRIRISDALELQITLINTNIEALENGNNTKNKKIIAKQKNVVNLLTKVRNVFVVNLEKAEPKMKREIQKEDTEIKQNNPGSTQSKTPEIMI